MKISNLIMVLFITILIGCESTNPIQDNSTDIIFQPDTITTDYNYNKIELSALYGSWNLQNVIFINQNGMIEHLEKYYKIQDKNKVMQISQNGINKILFWREPYYSLGTFIPEHKDSLSSFFMRPSGGAPSMIINLDLTNKTLTLISQTTIKLNNSDRVYDGKIIEEYKK